MINLKCNFDNRIEKIFNTIDTIENEFTRKSLLSYLTNFDNSIFVKINNEIMSVEADELDFSFEERYVQNPIDVIEELYKLVLTSEMEISVALSDVEKEILECDGNYLLSSELNSERSSLLSKSYLIQTLLDIVNSQRIIEEDNVRR